MSADEYLADGRPMIHPSRIAQFCNLNQCPAYLTHEYDDDIVEQFSDLGIDDVPLSPLLEATGTAHEREQLGALLPPAFTQLALPMIASLTSSMNTGVGTLTRT